MLKWVHQPPFLVVEFDTVTAVVDNKDLGNTGELDISREMVRLMRDLVGN